MSVDYKEKYKNIRAKLLESVDVAWRKGYEEGAKEAQMQAMQQQMQAMQEQQMAQQQAMQGQEVDPETGEPITPEEGGELSPEEQAMMEEQMAAEQGGGISEEGIPMGDAPEEMMGEGAGSELDEYIGQLEQLVQKGEKPKIIDLRKAVEALTDVRKNQKEQFMSKTKKVTTEQKKVVDNILKKWEDESKEEKTTKNLDDIIKENGIDLDLD